MSIRSTYVLLASLLLINMNRMVVVERRDILEVFLFLSNDEIRLGGHEGDQCPLEVLRSERWQKKMQRLKR